MSPEPTVAMEFERTETGPVLHLRLAPKPVLAAMLATVMLASAGCAPPPTRMADSGKKIIKIDPKPETIPVLFQDVEKEGRELLMRVSPVGRPGGTFYAGSIGRGPKTFNVHVSTDNTSSTLSGMMFVGLTTTHPYTGEEVPYLAKSVKVMPDERTYVVTLRKGLVWSDGHPLTADDVVFTWRDIIASGLSPQMHEVVSIKGRPPAVRKIDDLTVEFVTPEPFAPFKGMLSTSIFPRHIVAPVIARDRKAFDAFWGVTASPKTFVVNGPYMLEEYLSGQRVIMKRNPRFFMVDEKGQRLPYFERYVTDFVQDQNAEVLQFKQNRLDSLGVPGKDVFFIKHMESPDFTMYDLGPSTGTTFVVFNLNPRKEKNGKPYVPPVKSKWFRDLNFRRAVDYAIRRDQIIQNILMGIGAPLFTSESLASVWLNPKLAKGHPADLNKARAYLKASGFYWDSQGQLHDKAGNPVVFELNTNAGNLERESIAVAIKEDLAKLGMRVNLKTIEFNVLVGKMDTGQWESMIMGLTGSATEPHGGKNVWDSHGPLHLFNQRKPDHDMPGTDIMEPWEREIDTLMYKGATTLDREKRREYYNQLQQVVYDNLPFIYLYSPLQITAVRNRLKNVDPAPLGLFHNQEVLWVEE